jgi:thiol:disulfide interchange protein DsbD
MARKFPRTGPWAELTKQFMGFLLIGVAVFFAQQWVAKVVGGHERIWWVIYGVLVAGAVFLVARAFHYAKSRTAPTVAIIIALLLVVPTFFAAMKLTVKPYDWQEYSPQVLAQAQSGNQVVLVEFTASWCANCHTIEALYINDDAIRKDVGKYHVRMVKADLSAKTAPGWELLRDLGGEGVPLTAVYSPNLKEPILLTGFFGVDRLRDALAKAAQAPPAGGEAKTAMAQ